MGYVFNDNNQIKTDPGREVSTCTVARRADLGIQPVAVKIEGTTSTTTPSTSAIQHKQLNIWQAWVIRAH